MQYNNRELEQKRILIVEDMELNQYLARHIMESWGCLVQVAENGKLGLEKLMQGEFDLVLMDIQMPVMDGMEATRHIRNMDDQKKASIPIVALTANASKAECDRYMKMGMDACLPKPFDESALFEIVLKNILKDHSEPMKTSVMQVNGPAPVSATAVKYYDLSMVESISGGDEAFVLKMINLFLETVPIALTDLKASVDKQDWLQLSKQAHKLKSTIDSMGITELKQPIRTIEADGKNEHNTPMLTILVSKIVDGMELVMDQVKKDHSL